VPTTRARCSAKLTSASCTPATPSSAAFTVEPQFFWHIMPSTRKNVSGTPASAAASKPTASTAPTRSARDAVPTTRARCSAKLTSASCTPATPSSAAFTVEPQFFWHIIPSTRKNIGIFGDRLDR
jgi:hypothetical protein